MLSRNTTPRELLSCSVSAGWGMRPIITSTLAMSTLYSDNMSLLYLQFVAVRQVFKWISAGLNCIFVWPLEGSRPNSKGNTWHIKLLKANVLAVTYLADRAMLFLSSDKSKGSDMLRTCTCRTDVNMHGTSGVVEGILRYTGYTHFFFYPVTVFPPIS